VDGVNLEGHPDPGQARRLRCERWAVALLGLVGATVVVEPLRPPGEVPPEEAALLLLLGLFLVARSRRPRASPGIGHPALFFAVVVVLSTAAALASAVGIPSVAWLEEQWLRTRGLAPLDQLEIYNVPRAALVLLEGLGVMAMGSLTLQAGKGRGRAVAVILGIGAIAVLEGLFERATGIGLPRHWKQIEPLLRRVGSFFGDPNVFGSCLCLLLPLVGEAARPGRRFRVAALLLGAGALACLMLTWSRAAIGVVLSWGALGAWNRLGRARRMAGLLAGVAVALGALAALEAPAVRYWLKKTFDRAGVEQVLEGRVGLWQIGASMVVDLPMVGSGPGSVFRRYALYCKDSGSQSEGVGPNPALEGRNLHNTFVQLAAECGLLGLTGFAWLVAAALGRGLRSSEQSEARWSRAAGVGVVLFLLSGLTGHPLLDRGAALLFWLCLGLAASGEAPGKESAASASTRPESGPPGWFGVGLWVLLAVGGGLQAATALRMGRESLYEVGVYGNPGAWRSFAEQVVGKQGAVRPQWWWTAQSAELSVLPRGPQFHVRILMRHPRMDRDPVDVALRINGELRIERRFRLPGASELLVPLQPSELDGGPVRLGVLVSRPYVPAERGPSADRRLLGVALWPLQFDRRTEAEGFFPAEPGGSWTRLYVTGRSRRGGPAVIRFEVAHPELEREGLTLRLYAGDRLVSRRMATRPGPFEMPMDASVGAEEPIRLELSRTWSPVRYALSADSRELGVYIARGELESGPVDFGSGQEEGERRATE
jgi:O-antigen ligase/polysaccharide polymerase Wzy-like membrane protein